MILWPITGNLPVTNDSDAHLARGSGEAVDFAAWSGTEWLSCAPKTARVVKSGYDSECGFHLYLQWHDAETDWLLRARYCHGLMAPPWGVGALVEPGECVGFVGSSGRSTGPHLHFALERWTGQAWERLRPEDWLKAQSEPNENQTKTEEPVTDDEKQEALALLDIIYGVGRVLTSEQVAPDTLAALGEQMKGAAVRLKELTDFPTVPPPVES